MINLDPLIEMEGVWTKKTVRGFILGWFCSDGFGFRDFSGFAKLETKELFFDLLISREMRSTFDKNLLRNF